MREQFKGRQGKYPVGQIMEYANDNLHRTTKYALLKCLDIIYRISARRNASLNVYRRTCTTIFDGPLRCTAKFARTPRHEIVSLILGIAVIHVCDRRGLSPG